MKYIVTVERVIREFWRCEIESDSVKQAHRKALKQAHKDAEEECDTFCDGDEPRYRIYLTEIKK